MSFYQYKKTVWNDISSSQLTSGGPVEPLYPPSAWNGVVIVGEAPGATEVAHGMPFCGPSGKLLDKMIYEAGIQRSETLICNAFTMQPAWTMNNNGKRKNNDISLFFGTEFEDVNQRLPPYRGKYVKNGPDEDIRELWRLLSNIEAKVIITCGAIALWALTGEDQISSSAGESKQTKINPAPVRPTYHPAYALYRQDEDIAARIQNHIRKALKDNGVL